MLIIAFIIYFLYTLFQKREEIFTPELVEILPDGEEFNNLPSRADRRRKEEMKKKEEQVYKLNFNIFFFFTLGIIGLIIGVNYIVDSVLVIADFFNIGVTLIAITAVSIGTSLLELVVSVRAALRKKYEIALGNIFGSNVFNILLVIGIPSLINPLKVDDITFFVGVPFLILATLIFVISGISRRIHIWEGLMYLLIYALFIIKIIGY